MLTGIILKGSVVEVEKLADLPADQQHLRGRLGRVEQDSQPDTMVLVNFYGKPVIIHQFHRDALNMILDRNDPKWNFRTALNRVRMSDPIYREHLLAAMKLGKRNPNYDKIVEMLHISPRIPYKQIAKACESNENVVQRVAAKEGLKKQGPKIKPEKEEEVLREVEKAIARQDEERGKEGYSLAMYRSRLSVDHEVAIICGVKQHQVQALRMRRKLRINKEAWSPVKLRAYFKEIRALLPSLTDADLLKLLQDNGLLESLRFNRKMSIAEVLQAIRGGKPLEIATENGGGLNDGVTETDYEAPEVPANIHAADLAKQAGAPQEVIDHIIESQLAALRTQWFREGVPPVIS